MKKYAMLALATIFTINLSVMAQGQTPDQKGNWGKNEMKHAQKPMVSAAERADKMAKNLGLSAEEKEKVQALFEKQDAKRQEFKEKGEKIRTEVKTKMDAERKSNDEELAKIIGAEKFQKLQAMRTERMEKMKERMKERKESRENNSSETK